MYDKEGLIKIIQLTKQYYNDKINDILKGKNITLTEEKHLKNILYDITGDFDVICKEIKKLEVK